MQKIVQVGGCGGPGGSGVRVLIPPDQVTVAGPTSDFYLFPSLTSLTFLPWGVKAQSDAHYSNKNWRIMEGFHPLKPLV